MCVRLLSLVSTVALFLAFTADSAIAQSAEKDRNARSLRAYMQPYQVSKLEWELLQFNLLWSGSFTNPGSYLTSYPVVFDYRTMRFRVFFSISETREYQDPELWSRLIRIKRESILQGGVDQLRDLLGQTFPEVKAKPELLFVEFKFRQSGGGAVNAATFENGTLKLAE